MESDVDVQSRIRVKWGSRNVEQTLRSGHPEVAQWLYEQIPKGEHDHGENVTKDIIREALNVGAEEFAEAIMPEGTNVLDYAMDCKRLEVIERLVDGEYFTRDDFSASRSISHLVRADRLDLMERISTQQNLPPDHAEYWSIDWFQALSTACETGNMTVLRWLVEHPLGDELIEDEKHSGGFNGLLCHAAEGGHTDVMEYLNDEGIISEYTSALFYAIRENQPRSVKWLVEHFPQSEKVPNYCVMDEAARLGRLDILKYLQSLDASLVPGWAPIRTNRRGGADQSVSSPMLVVSTDDNLKVRKKGAFRYQSKWFATDAMDHAAANGHLDVVKWFHNNRPEDCSTDAIDAAAANGHLEIVQWLSANGKQEFTTQAMDGAASNGNLEMVKWLHENGKAGCTESAMDRAASNGHLKTLKWLHANRSEGCTIKAIEGATGRGHLHVACWLQMRYPQYSPSNVDINVFAVNKFEIFLFVHTHYAYIFTRAFVQNILGDRMRENPNGNNADIIAWFHENYPEESGNVVW